MRISRVSLAAAFFFSAILVSGAPISLPPNFSETSVPGINPATAIALAPDGRIFVTEQTGAVRIIQNGVLLSTPFVTITVDSTGERGLLGITLDPDFATNQYVYVYYTVPAGGGNAAHNRVSRFTGNGNTGGNEFVLLNLDDLTSVHHNGGALHFGTDGKLYIASGDNECGSTCSQVLTDLFGKILRINSDGSIPTNNPFYNMPPDRGEIWTYGQRNPFTFGIDNGPTFPGMIFVNDVGENTWEEIDVASPGGDYGWADCEGPYVTSSTTVLCTTQFPLAGYTNPFYWYQDDQGSPATCAIVGGDFYDPPSPTFPAGYVGKYFFSDLCAGWVEYVDPNGLSAPPVEQTPSSFASGFAQPVDVLGGDDGNLYVLDRGTGGANSSIVYIISYTGGGPVPSVTSIAPPSGPAVGGTEVMITGSNFISGATAKFGGVPATGISVVDSSHISATVPALSPGTLDDVTVINPGNLPGTLPQGWFADFLDVPQANPFHDDVEKIFRLAITAGCGGGNYCPSSSVTRQQMAVFLLKSEHGSGYQPPACTGVFGDVPCPSQYANWIERLFAEGITAGCGGGDYCPSTPVLRQQMAVFLLKTQHGASYLPPACSGTFGDVPCPSQYANWIEQLHNEGVTAGCGGGDYCPAAPVLRGQMATFLVRTFGF
jgi:glucose/arabinose dehydrogenase